jgi:hypothetical protein
VTSSPGHRRKAGPPRIMSAARAHRRGRAACRRHHHAGPSLKIAATRRRLRSVKHNMTF